MWETELEVKELMISTLDRTLVYYKNKETNSRFQFLGQIEGIELRSERKRVMRYWGKNIIVRFKRCVKFSIRVKNGWMYVEDAK